MLGLNLLIVSMMVCVVQSAVACQPSLALALIVIPHLVIASSAVVAITSIGRVLNFDRALRSLLIVHLILEQDRLVLIILRIVTHLVVLLLYSRRGLQSSHLLQRVVV